MQRLNIAIPKIITLLLIFLASLEWRIPGLSSFPPIFGTMAIFYWAFYRPHTMPYWFVFIAGIFQDSLIGFPIGISALSYMLMIVVIAKVKEKITLSDFTFTWQLFIPFACIFVVSIWVLYSFANNEFVPFDLAVVQICLSIAIYPLIHALCHKFYNLVPEMEYDV